MRVLTRSQILQAMDPSPWDFANRVLYELCRKHPGHTDAGAVLAKVNFIGRTYAAAIERRRNKSSEEANNDFYLSKVAPTIIRSPIDRWLRKARATRPGTSASFELLVQVHGKTTSLFHTISGLEKRSLASKYLHFHVPKLFFIYDSRAVQALRPLSSILPRASRSAGADDNEYRKFAEKCFHLVRFCTEEFGLRPTPRQLDNLFLRVNER